MSHIGSSKNFSRAHLNISICINLIFIATSIVTKIINHPTQQQLIKSQKSAELIVKSIKLTGNKNFAKIEIPTDPNILKGKNTLNITYDLHGLCALPGQASQIAFNSGTNTYPVSLAEYGKNCQTGQQNISIPFSDFDGLNQNRKNFSFSIKIWYPTTYTVDITNAIIYKDVLAASTKNTSTPSLKFNTTNATKAAIANISAIPSMTPPQENTGQSWTIQSVSAMKETKDIICNPRSIAFINQWVTTAKDLGVNYISIETPYDNPACGDSLAYTKEWVTAIRAQKLHVWHRHMPMAFEGIYSTPKDQTADYITMISTYIKNNPNLFQAGDIFTPIPEPQNGGIKGITYCPEQICIFSGAADFNHWLRLAMNISQKAFTTIGLSGKVQVGYFGFDGFVTWGDNNPDWSGILEKKTVQQMGNITIDHYPEAVGKTMSKS